MGFNIPKIEDADWYLDVAFRRANKKADDRRGTFKGNRLEKSRKIEVVKVQEIQKSLHKQLNSITTAFPSIDALSEFYQELIRVTFDYDKLKKSLGTVAWGVDKIHDLSNDHVRKIRQCEELDQINTIRRAFFGRIASVLKQIKKALTYLDEVRQAMRDFPSIKMDMFTVAIAGFPNVGKTTLLSKITSSKPEIAAYAFTTKKLNIGYIELQTQKIQVIDTPGTLNRFEKMNAIEKQATLALKYCAEVIVYVFDLTEPFPLKDQKKLLEKIRELDKTVLIYISKTDILDGETVTAFREEVSRSCFTDPSALAAEIVEKHIP